MPRETVAFDDVTVKHETDKALLCVIEEDEYWVPKSQISEDSEVYNKESTGTLIVSQWWAEQNDLEGTPQS